MTRLVLPVVSASIAYYFGLFPHDLIAPLSWFFLGCATFLCIIDLGMLRFLQKSDESSGKDLFDKIVKDKTLGGFRLDYVIDSLFLLVVLCFLDPGILNLLFTFAAIISAYNYTSDFGDKYAEDLNRINKYKDK